MERHPRIRFSFQHPYSRPFNWEFHDFRCPRPCSYSCRGTGWPFRALARVMRQLRKSRQARRGFCHFTGNIWKKIVDFRERRNRIKTIARERATNFASRG